MLRIYMYLYYQQKSIEIVIYIAGVIVLVLAYTAMGSILFMSLEGEDEDNKTVETAVAASKPYPRSDLANAEIRTK